MNRIEALKRKLFEMDERAIFLERLEILEVCARKYEGETPGVKFGHTLSELLNNISVVIDPDDLIVGRIHEVVPTSEQEQDFYASQEYWYPEWFRATGGMTISWEMLLRKGLRGIKEDAEAKLDQISDSNSHGKRDFLSGVALCCDAIADFISRYAQAASNRQTELRQVAEICECISQHPPQSFHDAVQLIWFVDLVLHAVVGARDYALGRFDQHLYPFYAKDIQSESLTRDRALELLQCLLMICFQLLRSR